MEWMDDIKELCQADVHTQHHGAGPIGMETSCHLCIGHQRAQAHGMSMKKNTWECFGS